MHGGSLQILIPPLSLGLASAALAGRRLALGLLTVLAVVLGLALGRSAAARQRLEEGLQPILRHARAGLLQLLNAAANTRLLEAVLGAHKLNQGLFVGHYPLEICVVDVGDLGRDKQLARFFELPVLRHLVLLCVQVLEDLLDRVVLLDERQCAHWANAANRVAVIAAKENAHVDELRHAQAHAVENLCERNLLDRHFAGLAEGHVTQQDGRAEREGVHVLGRNAVDLARLDEVRALSLGLTGSRDERNAHQLEQLLALLVVLRQNLDEAARELLHIFGGALLVGRAEAFLSRLAALLALGELAGLERGRLAIEDVQRLDAVVDHADCAEEEAREMARGLALLVHQIRALAADSNEKLVNAHRGINGNLPAKVVLHLALLDRLCRIVANDLRESLNSHVCSSNEKASANSDDCR
eukprot:m.212081 g.212081  ORF g.212081 m.212081 type:complete len:414 (-) comp19507_c0_seq1:98-1339(-)